MPKSARTFCTKKNQGILLAETSSSTASEFASVLATSGTASAESKSIDNSWKVVHLVEPFSTQWNDAALAARDAKVMKSEAVVAAIDNFDLDSPRINKINEYEDDDDGYYDEDVDWYTGDCDDELDETAYTVRTPTDDPELIEQFDGNLEDADASASSVCVSKSQFSRSTRASVSCQECQRLFSCCWHWCFWRLGSAIY